MGSRIATAMNALLRHLKMTQQELADDLHVTRLSINMLCKGKRNMTIEMALRLKQYTGCPARWWLNLQVDDEVERATNDKQLQKELKKIKRKDNARHIR